MWVARIVTRQLVCTWPNPQHKLGSGAPVRRSLSRVFTACRRANVGRSCDAFNSKGTAVRLTSSVPLLIVGTAMVGCVWSETAEAQLFGQRTVGRPLSRQAAPSMEDVGTVTVGRRFLRSERGRGEFVGSDRGDVGGFVGSTQGRTTGTVASSTAGLREQVRPPVNRPLKIKTGSTIYPPKLEPLLPISVPADGQQSLRTRQHLAQLFAGDQWAQIAVSVEDRKATLSGLVPSESDRQKAELLLLFEPGIDSVQNDLQIAQPVPPPPQPKFLPKSTR